MPREHSYAMRLRWTGSQHGPTSGYRAYSREWTADFAGRQALVGSADPTFRGDPALHNPEDLLVAALSSCHMLSYLALCARDGILVLEYEDEATGVMSPDGESFSFTNVTLRPQVVIAQGERLARAQALHHPAHELCFIARSVNFEVRCEPAVVARPPADD